MENGALFVNFGLLTSYSGVYEEYDDVIYWYFTLDGDSCTYVLEKVSDGVLSINDDVYYCKDGKTPPKK